MDINMGTRNEMKMVILMRTDLNMRKGKMVAQGCHAAVDIFLDRVAIDDNGIDVYHRIDLNADMKKWLEYSRKICLGVDSEAQLKDIYEKAKAAGLPCSLIRDDGLVDLKGIPTYTAVAIGPAHEDKINPLTGHLKLI